MDDESRDVLGVHLPQEVYLTYRRVQDIHVSRNIIERWMGLAKVPALAACFAKLHDTLARRTV